MIHIRPAAERGATHLDWLDSRHSFSFAEYRDRNWMSFRSLRVINDDRVDPGKGFGFHPHRDMEILTYVIEGAVEHHDSLGTGSIIRPGELQRMSAGTGIVHSEKNPSSTEPLRLLQIWLLPDQRGIDPGYEQKSFPDHERRGRLRLVASRNGRDGSITVHQDAEVYAALLAAGERVTHPLAPARAAWIQIARGSVRLDGRTLAEGDGAAVSDVASVDLTANDDADVLLFDLA